MLAGADNLYTIFFEKQCKALCHAKSLTGRIFTGEKCAVYHCQISNVTLAYRLYSQLDDGKTNLFIIKDKTPD